MAEVLGIIASGISIAQIAGQLVSCVQQLRAFCRSMRDIPNELNRILDEVQILGEVFTQLGEFEGASSGLLQASLLHCKAAAATLERLAEKSNDLVIDDRGKKPWGRLRATLRKEELRELRERLEATKSLLQLAMTCHSM